MALSRSTALLIRNVLDDWLPPKLRDSRWFMSPLLWFVFRGAWRTFADFKQIGFAITAEEFSDVYATTASKQKVQGCTDLNDECVSAILENILGANVVDVGCGRGYLAGRLGKVSDDVTGCDIVLDKELPQGAVTWVQGSVESLPFKDQEFDTVVCTHTLEHVRDLPTAIAELRRITRRRLIIVVPKERPYRYTFNLHLHFFPHAWSVQAALGVIPGARLEDLGDWFYVEDMETVTA